ncbi:MAG: GspH/FimT family pseudopilin [Gammaproteobacteria bacterium]|nr:GspH/FimT family pseudopilin [Gammaproteobacteria bacterium]
MKKQSGFTLVELMVTLLVAAILLVAGVPSFVEMLRSNRVASEANNMVTALNMARSEALKLGQQVTVARTGANWEDGWRVFSDMDGDGSYEIGDGDTEIQIFYALSDNYTLRAVNFTDWIAYLPSGLSTGSSGLANGTFRLCADDQDTETGRDLVINAVGRVRIDEGATSCP